MQAVDILSNNNTAEQSIWPVSQVTVRDDQTPTLGMNASHFMRPQLTAHLIHETDKRSWPVRRMLHLIRDMFVSQMYQQSNHTTLLLYTYIILPIHDFYSCSTGFYYYSISGFIKPAVLNWIQFTIERIKYLENIFIECFLIALWMNVIFV